MLRKSVTQRQEIPGEPGEWMDLRQLGWYELADAQRARRGESFDNIRLMGKDLWKTMQETRAEMGDAADQASDPLQSYDLETLLTMGIVAWSYPEPLGVESIRLLDPDTAEWAARRIIGKAESEADRKNGSGGSTSRSTDGEKRPKNG